MVQKPRAKNDAGALASSAWIARPDTPVAGEARGPLAGARFAIGDTIDLAGVPTTAGCPGFAAVPAMQAAVVRRLPDAGASALGKTNLDPPGASSAKRSRLRSPGHLPPRRLACLDGIAEAVPRSSPLLIAANERAVEDGREAACHRTETLPAF